RSRTPVSVRSSDAIETERLLAAPSPVLVLPLATQAALCGREGAEPSRVNQLTAVDADPVGPCLDSLQRGGDILQLLVDAEQVALGGLSDRQIGRGIGRVGCHHPFVVLADRHRVESTQELCTLAQQVLSAT